MHSFTYLLMKNYGEHIPKAHRMPALDTCEFRKQLCDGGIALSPLYRGQREALNDAPRLIQPGSNGAGNQQRRQFGSKAQLLAPNALVAFRK